MSVKIRTGLVVALLVVLIGAAVIEGAYLTTKITGVEMDLSFVDFRQSNGNRTDHSQFQRKNGEQANKGENQSLSKEAVVQPRKVRSYRQWEIWKTIKLGTIKSPDRLGNAIRAAGMKIDGTVKSALDDLPIAAVPTEVDLVRVKLCNFDFPRATHISYDEICRKAAMEGLQNCSPEVGPQLRLQYRDQPNDDFLIIAMPMVMNKDGVKMVFGVKKDIFGEPCLGYHSPSIYWTARGNSETAFIFVRPRD